MPNIEHGGSSSVEPEPLDHQYRYFGSLAARDYFELSRELATYTHDEDIASVVLTDKAARPAYVGLVECWRAAYPAEPRPLVCFMNPIGVQPLNCLAPIRRVRGAAEVITAGLGQSAEPRSEHDVARDFEATFTELCRHKDLPLLVVDTCLHSGESVRPILNRLETSGFTDVRLAVVETSYYARTPSVTPDLVLRGDDAVGGCYSFGHQDQLVTKTFDRVVSTPSAHPAHQRAGRELRAEARAIIAQGLRRSGYVATASGSPDERDIAEVRPHGRDESITPRLT